MFASQTRFGVQPAKLVLYRGRWSVARAARDIGESCAHLTRAVNGINRPSERVRRLLPSLVGVPLEELFTEEALAKPHRVRRPRRPNGSVFDRQRPGTRATYAPRRVAS